MSEKWKPEKGEKFWFINYTGDFHSTTYYGDGIDPKFIEFGNIFKTKEEAEAAVEKVKDLLLSLQEPFTDCNQLPKLTAEVFDRPDCPAWAKYAAVDECGSVRLFSHAPWLGASCWNWSHGEVTYLFGVKFDASNWQNSRIERQKKKQACSENLGTFARDQKMNYINGLKNKKSELAVFSDWCKVGEWVYSPCCCNPDKGTYFKVTQIDDVCIIGEDYVCHVDNAVRAQLRPYNAKEMKALVGKVIECPKGAYLVTFFALGQVKVAESLITADGLKNNWTHIDGKPCGVLEHLNENGEWVE